MKMGQDKFTDLSKQFKEASDTTHLSNLTNLSKVVFNENIIKNVKNIFIFQGSVKKSKKYIKKTFINIIGLEGLEENINIIQTKFFEKSENILKQDSFRQKYFKILNGSYLDLLLLMKEYQEFNLFDYINQDTNLYNIDDSHKGQTIRKKFLALRNNLFLRIIIEASYIYSNINEKSKIILDDMSYLKPHIEIFKNIICDRDKTDTLEIDVEVFFLTILGYKEKARSIVVKFYDYFKKIINDISGSEILTKSIFENLDIISDKDYIDLTDIELIILRKTINNCIKRNFYKGIEFLCENEIFCYCMSEGRIWKSIIKYFDTEKIL